MIVSILLGVLTLAVLVLAFLASKVWHWAHVLVLVTFYFASVGYAILAARSLDTRLTYQKQYARAAEQLERVSAHNDALARGAGENARDVIGPLAGQEVLVAQEASENSVAMDGVIDLEHNLRLKSRARGRVWRFATPTGPIDPETGAVPVGFPVRRPTVTEEDEFDAEPTEEPAGPPPALGLEPDAIVYVFEQSPPGGVASDAPPRSFLGEFRVDSVQGREAVLEPLDHLELDQHAAERLATSVGPWVVYETMPADDRDLFAGMDEETLRRLLPPSSVQEYLRDRTPATPDDPPQRTVGLDADGNVLPPDTPESEIVSKQFRRRTRDYAFLLNDFERVRAELVAREQAITADIEKLNAALEDAKAIEAYRQAELAKWRADLAAVEREREAIERHASALQRQVAVAQRMLEETLQANAQLAAGRLNARGDLSPIGSGAIDIDAL